MKKVLSFTIVLLLTILVIGNVSAKSNELEVTNVEIIEKSDEVKANIENYKDLNINLNTLFFSKGNYVKYKITIKNNTKSTMKIDDILDNFNSEVLETSYDIDKKELKSNEEYTFTLTIKCIKDIEEEKVTITSPLNIIINYDNGKTATIDINPDTKDSIITYFIIFVLSAISLFLVITKRGKKQLLGLMLIVSLIPITSNAVSTKKEITINNNIKVYGKTAVFKTGIEVNKQLKELAGNDINTTTGTYNITDVNIKSFVRTNELLDEFIPSEDNIISTEESRIPIYAWFDNGIIYYYTEASNPLLNEDSSYMFCNITKIVELNLDSIDTSNLVNMRNMFYNLNEIEELDLSNFDTSNVENMYWVFGTKKDAPSKLENLDLSNFNTSNVTNMSALFANHTGLKTINLSSFDTSKVEDMSGMFIRCTNLENVDLSNFNTNSLINMSYMFRECKNLEYLDLNSFNTSNVNNMLQLFYLCDKLENVKLDNFDTSKVVDMSWMFGGCKNLKELDLSSFYTPSVTNMKSMFSGCSNLESVILNKFDTSSVTDMSFMFYECNKLKQLDLSSFVPSNVETMKSMFYNCSSLENITFLNFNTNKVTIMSSMFSGCTNLTELDLSSFKTSNVVNMGHMFYNCNSLAKLNISNFDTSNVTDMQAMFYRCQNLEELDLTSFNTNKVTTMIHMFNRASSLKTIYASENFITNNVTDSDYMFWVTPNLVGGNGTAYNSSYRDKTYARIDTLELAGYFTLK